jgi:hypothetical protein
VQIAHNDIPPMRKLFTVLVFGSECELTAERMHCTDAFRKREGFVWHLLTLVQRCAILVVI